VTFANPPGLLALLAIPAIVAIHMFRRRFPVRPVAGLFLWHVTRQTPEGGGKIARLPITASLILECLAALALALILADARLSAVAVSQHLVVVLDDSASMSAVDARGDSARDRAVTRVLLEVDRLGKSARITLISSGDRPSVVAGPAALAVEARSALDTWTPDAPNHSLALGIRLARELAGRTGRLMVVSDLPPMLRGEAEVEGALWVAVGEPLANVGITAAERSIAPAEGRGTISLALGNYSESATRRRLEVTSGGKSILARDVEVPPGMSSFTLPIPPGLPALHVGLSGDALLRDNDVTLVEPRPRLVGVENRLREGRGRQALVKALDAITGVTHAESGHLVFVDAGELDRPSAPGVWRVGFGRAPAGWLAQGQPRDFIGPFVIEKRHPLLLGMTLGGVVWSGVTPIAPNVVRPIASAGDQVLIGMTPVTAARTEPAVLVNLDLDRTNLIRSPDWPIFISNLVEMRRQALPGPERWNYRIGEWVRVRLGRDPKGPLHFRCGAVERTLPPGRQLEFVAPSPGGLLQILEGDEVLFELGVNFLDQSEADLRHQATADLGTLAEAPGMRGESGPSSDPVFWALLAIAGTAIVANWCVLSPRHRPA
jgi:Ca-activated chloride channel homolog